MYSVQAIKTDQTSSSKADINVKQQEQKALKSTRKLNTQRKRMPKIKDMEKDDTGELDKVFEKMRKLNSDKESKSRITEAKKIGATLDNKESKKEVKKHINDKEKTQSKLSSWIKVGDIRQSIKENKIEVKSEDKTEVNVIVAKAIEVKVDDNNRDNKTQVKKLKDVKEVIEDKNVMPRSKFRNIRRKFEKNIGENAQNKLPKPSGFMGR